MKRGKMELVASGTHSLLSADGTPLLLVQKGKFAYRILPEYTQMCIRDSSMRGLFVAYFLMKDVLREAGKLEEAVRTLNWYAITNEVYPCLLYTSRCV